MRRLWLMVFGLWLVACTAPTLTPASVDPGVSAEAGVVRIPFVSEVEEVMFVAADGVRLAGQLDRPLAVDAPPLIVIIHHSGAVDRNAYQYLAARLVPAGYAVFRFDKRGVGRSEGEYGCCEADDAVAAYAAAIAHLGYAPPEVIVVAQSLGSAILAEKYAEFEAIHAPSRVLLLSSLLTGDAILPITAPIFIVVSDSEANLAAISEEAMAAYQAENGADACFYVAPHTEHTLFDVSTGPIDWSAPDWPLKFSADAWRQIAHWLSGGCAAIASAAIASAAIANPSVAPL